jgi:hypothetical protein
MFVVSDRTWGVIRNSLRNVIVSGVSMFVVAGAISRSGRAGYIKTETGFVT